MATSGQPYDNEQPFDYAVDFVPHNNRSKPTTTTLHGPELTSFLKTISMPQLSQSDGLLRVEDGDPTRAH